MIYKIKNKKLEVTDNFIEVNNNYICNHYLIKYFNNF